MQYDGGRVTSSMASWAGKVLETEEARPDSQSKDDIKTAVDIWAQWKKQGEKE